MGVTLTKFHLRPISLLTILFALLVPAISAVFELSEWGWDFDLYAQSVKQWQQGVNPYKTHGESLSLFYPPLYLFFYSVIMMPWEAYVSVVTLLTVFALTLLVLRYGSISLLLAGFLGLNTAILSGNFAAIEFIIFAFCLLAVGQHRYFTAGLLFSIIIAAKITPIFFLPGMLLFLPPSVWRRTVGGTLLGFSLVFLLSGLFWPDELVNFFNSFSSISQHRSVVLHRSISPLDFLSLFLFDGSVIPLIRYSVSALVLGVVTLLFATSMGRNFLIEHRIGVCALLFFASPRIADYSMFYGAGVIALKYLHTQLSERREWLLIVAMFILPVMLSGLRRIYGDGIPPGFFMDLLLCQNGGLWVLAMLIASTSTRRRVCEGATDP